MSHPSVLWRKLVLVKMLQQGSPVVLIMDMHYTHKLELHTFGRKLLQNHINYVLKRVSTLTECKSIYFRQKPNEEY